MYYVCGMRTIIRTDEFNEFYNSLPAKARSKVEYALLALRELPIVNSKFVKKLVDTEFYELRVSVDNEYRVIMVSVNTDNIMEAKEVILLNGFVKKSTKDYKTQIDIANRIVKKYRS